MEPRHIGSNERAALIQLYSQYEFKNVEIHNSDVHRPETLNMLNSLGAEGWHIVSSDWHEDGVLYVMQRQTFSLTNALKRSGHGT
jgi:hypothetical protein